MRYDVNMLYNKKAHIKITTWHAPITCDGDYDVEEINNVYILN